MNSTRITMRSTILWAHNGCRTQIFQDPFTKREILIALEFYRLEIAALGNVTLAVANIRVLNTT